MGTPEQPHRAVESNLAAFVLAPSLVTAVSTSLTTAAGVSKGTISFDVAPELRAGQHAVLFLNQLLDPGAPDDAVAAAYSFASAPLTADTATASFAVEGIVDGTYLVQDPGRRRREPAARRHRHRPLRRPDGGDPVAVDATDWGEANQAYLVATLAEIRAAFTGEPAAAAARVAGGGRACDRGARASRAPVAVRARGAAALCGRRARRRPAPTCREQPTFGARARGTSRRALERARTGGAAPPLAAGRARAGLAHDGAAQDRRADPPLPRGRRLPRRAARGHRRPAASLRPTSALAPADRRDGGRVWLRDGVQPAGRAARLRTRAPRPPSPPMRARGSASALRARPASAIPAAAIEQEGLARLWTREAMLDGRGAPRRLRGRRVGEAVDAAVAFVEQVRVARARGDAQPLRGLRRAVAPRRRRAADARRSSGRCGSRRSASAARGLNGSLDALVAQFDLDAHRSIAARRRRRPSRAGRRRRRPALGRLPRAGAAAARRPRAADRAGRRLGRPGAARSRSWRSLREIAAHVAAARHGLRRLGLRRARARAASASARCSRARAAPARRWPPRCSPTSCASTSTASTSPRSSASTSARPRRTCGASSTPPRTAARSCSSTRPTRCSASAARSRTATTATPTSRSATCCSGWRPTAGWRS